MNKIIKMAKALNKDIDKLGPEASREDYEKVQAKEEELVHELLVTLEVVKDLSGTYNLKLSQLEPEPVHNDPIFH